MSESLKSNTTLTKLNLRSKDKRKTHKKTSISNSLFSLHFTTTGNKIGDTGATSLSEALKSNITLTKLDMSGEDQIENTQKYFQQTTAFHVLRIYR